MFIRQTLLSISIATLGWCLSGSNALAAYFAPMTNYTKSDWNEKVTRGGFVEEFNVSSYIGDQGNAFYELELNDIKPPDIVKSTQQKQFSWANEEVVNFELSLTTNQDNTKTLTYIVGGKTLMSEDVIDELDINGMMLMANSTDTSDVMLKNLKLDGGSRSMENLFSEDGEMDFLQITGIDEDFRFTGKQVFTWDDADRPEKRELGYNIQVGNFQSTASSSARLASNNIQQEIPEPSTISFFSLLAIATGIKLRKK